VTFELTVLCAVLSAMIGMFALNKLPALDHPLFDTERFSLATRDRFFLYIESLDPLFDREATRKFLLQLKAHEVIDVQSESPYRDP
jgi:hypothetical protein